MRGADALIRALERAGVDTVFGIPGGACLPIYDALHDSPIRHVLMRHEAAAGHAAEGYARATGRVGVAIGTSGPGATNLVTAIADAQMDSTPTLFITGQVKTTLRGTERLPGGGRDRHHAADRQALDRDRARRRRRPGGRRRAPHRHARGRPGPVLIDLPIDIASAPARDATHEPYLPGYRPRERPERAPGALGGGGASRPRGARCSTRAAASSRPTRRTSCATLARLPARR